MAKTPWIRRLTDPDQAAEHYRLVIDPGDLGRPTALVLCCDDDGYPATHLHLVDCDLDATPSDCAEVLDELLERLECHPHPVYAGVSLGLTRPGGDQVQAYDKAWFRALYRVCHRRGLDALGVYLVSRGTARPVHIDDAA